MRCSLLCESAEHVIDQSCICYPHALRHAYYVNVLRQVKLKHKLYCAEFIESQIEDVITVLHRNA